NNSEPPNQGDLLGTGDSVAPADESKKGKDKQRKRLDGSKVGVLWRGAKEGRSKIIESRQDLRRGDTLVLPTTTEGWNELGHVPAQARIDVADQAFQKARDRAVLRLHPTLRSQLPDSPVLSELIDWISEREESVTQTELRQFLNQAAESL